MDTPLGLNNMDSLNMVSANQLLERPHIHLIKVVFSLVDIMGCIF